LLHISPPSSNDEDNEIDVDNDEQFDYEDDLPLSSWIALNKCFELPFTENPCEDDIVNSVSEESEVIDSSEDESDTDTLRVPTNEVFKAVNTLSNFLSAQENVFTELFCFFENYGDHLRKRTLQNKKGNKYF
jgi:hypothetical protein